MSARKGVPAPWRSPLRWFLSRGLAVRLAVSTSALIFLACVALSGILVRRDFAEIHRSVVDRGRTISEFLARESELSVLSGDAVGLRQLASVARAQRDVVYCRFFDADGRPLAALGEEGVRESPPPADDIRESAGPVAVGPGVWEFHAPIFTTEEHVQREELEFPTLGVNGRLGAAVQKRIGAVAIGVALGPLAEHRRLAFVTAVFVTTVIALVAVLSAVLMTRAFTRPLQALASAADDIARGHLRTVDHPHTGDEMSAVAESFNAMVQSLAQSRATLEEYSRTLEVRSERLEVLNRELEEASRLKSEFLAQVSHELRTPLNVIIGYADMIAEGGGGPVSSGQHEMLSAIRRYSELQLDLVTDVLDLSRLSSGRISFHVERFPLEPLLAEIVGLHRTASAAHGVQFALDVAPDVGELETDRVKLQEIVRNLVDNAIKFTERGSISILASTVDGGQDRVRVEVRDTGSGIPSEELTHIFDEFHQVGQSSTRASRGVGLGLSIVKRLAEALDGSVSVESHLGSGSTFRVEIARHLPLPRAKAVADG
ncbi:MAG TPA: ATP-binding protein [Candidatus Binatus sp.]|nr:ATP-binding protein [Candidatus Binatus sp.]